MCLNNNFKIDIYDDILSLDKMNINWQTTTSTSTVPTTTVTPATTTRSTTTTTKPGDFHGIYYTNFMWSF